MSTLMKKSRCKQW